MIMPYELYARFKLLYKRYKSSLAKKIQNKSNIQYFCVLCNTLFRSFVVFTNLFRKSLRLPVQSDTLNP